MRKQYHRIGFTEAQRTELWARWRKDNDHSISPAVFCLCNMVSTLTISNSLLTMPSLIPLLNTVCTQIMLPLRRLHDPSTKVVQKIFLSTIHVQSSVNPILLSADWLPTLFALWRFD